MNGSYKLRQGKSSWQWAKHAWLYIDLLPALKETTFASSGFSTVNGTLFSASTVPHYWTEPAFLYSGQLQ